MYLLDIFSYNNVILLNEMKWGFEMRLYDLLIEA